MLTLANNIKGRAFSEFISLWFDIADIFSLTKNGWSNVRDNAATTQLLKQLDSSHIRTIHTNQWFCNRVPQGYDIEVYIFS